MLTASVTGGYGKKEIEVRLSDVWAGGRKYGMPAPAEESLTIGCECKRNRPWDKACARNITISKHLMFLQGVVRGFHQVQQ